MSTMIKSLSEMGIEETKLAALAGWKLTAILSEDCLSYVACHPETKEALLIDPKREELSHYQTLAKNMTGYTWIAVIDTHTHADHVSAAAEMAAELNAPLLMHSLSPSTKVELRVCKRTRLQTRAGPVELIPTPGHTQDGITAVWGPFVFTGDTVFFNDVGRDDLPGGSPEDHYESLQTLKRTLSPDAVMLPGHDFKGGRAALWSLQLKTNESLSQARENFVAEAGAFHAPAPKDFKRSLFENLK